MLLPFTRVATAGRTLALGLGLLGAATLPAAAQLAYGLRSPFTGVIVPVPTSLVSFDISSTNTIIASTTITGLAAGQVLVGLDARPATGELFTLGYNPTGPQAQLYSLHPTTAVLTAVGGPLTLSLGARPERIGFDFDPVADRIRVTSGSGANYRLHPGTGALVATDGTLAYAATDANAGQTPGVGASAYTNSYAGAATTTLYNLDEANNRLVLQNPPAAGTLNTVATLPNQSLNYSIYSDLDVYYNPATGANVAYVAVTNSGIAGLYTGLYTFNLTNGVSSSVGPLGGSGTPVRDIAIAIPTGVTTGTKTAELASNLSLSPNPLASSTQLHFSLPRAAHVELTVTDALGRTLDHVNAGLLLAGPQVIRWARRGQAAGVYFFRLCLDGQPAGTRQAVLAE